MPDSTRTAPPAVAFAPYTGSRQSVSVDDSNAPRLSSRTLIAGFVVVSAVLRILWAMHYSLSLEGEGVEYTRIAENLLAGRGYIGIFANGTQLNFPPLYPLLIAGTSLLLPNAEIAAHVVNVVCGAILLIPVFKIAEQAYGRRAAIVVGILFTLHPVLIAGSASAFAEIPYLTLLVFGLFWLVQWTTGKQIRNAILAGVFFGLAYLVRPEAFVLAGEFTMLAVIGGVILKDRRLLMGAVALPLAFAVVAAPNVIFLTKATGKLRIEAKGTLAYEWGSRINAGMSYQEAVKGIGEDLSDQGVFMRPNRDVITSAKYTSREYLAFVLRAVRRNAGIIERTIVDDHAFGSPLLFILVVLGLFRAGWSRERLLLDGPILLTAATVVAILGTVQETWFRYFYSLLGLFLLWGGKGTLDLGDWAAGTVSSVTNNARITRLIGPLTTGAALLAVLALAWRSIADVSQFQESNCGECVKAGHWLASQSPRPKWIMAGGDRIAYYAGADLMYLPYARADLAIRYVAKRRPDFIVLDNMTVDGFPYMRQWLDGGIPDPRAQLVHEEAGPHVQIKIYRWRDPATAP